jgi:uncharacterized membrane protein
MKIYILSYVAAAVVLLGLDALWLSVMGGVLYRPALGDLMADKFHLLPAVCFYALYVVGVVYFPISAAFESGRWSTALVQGAVFGLMAYGTYDLTNQATLRHWSTALTIADMSWGAVLTASSATLSYLLVNAFAAKVT